MKILVIDSNGKQIVSIPWNLESVELKKGSVVEYLSEKYKIKSFVKLVDHYIIFNGVKVKQINLNRNGI